MRTRLLLVLITFFVWVGNATASEPETAESGSASELSAAVQTLLAEFHRPPPAELKGDALTQSYVRRLALAAQPLPAHLARRAFLVTLGIGFDDTSFLRNVPGIGGAIEKLESPANRSLRLKHIRQATVSGRRDLTLHFFVSAMLCAELGENVATFAGWWKEIRDEQVGSGFDKTDLAADRAGIQFARSVLTRQKLLLEVAEDFRCPKIDPIKSER